MTNLHFVTNTRNEFVGQNGPIEKFTADWAIRLRFAANATASGQFSIARKDRETIRGTTMGYIDLMLVRTPGKKLAKFAGGADKSLQKVANSLGRLDDLGRALKPDTLLGDHYARREALYRFSQTESVFAQGSNDAWNYARTDNPSLYSYENLITKADNAGDYAIDLRNRYSQLPERMLDSVGRAARRGESAENLLRNNNYGEAAAGQRRFAAQNAANDLRDGTNAMTDARFGLETKLGPYAEHDNVRFRVEYLAADARDRAAVAFGAGMNIGSRTNAYKTSRALNATAGEVDAAVQSLVPGQPVTQIDELAKRGSAEANVAVEAARKVKTPKHFAAKVAAAYTGTIGVVAGVPAAGFVVYKTKLSD
jgi:hypothetical protein